MDDDKSKPKPKKKKPKLKYPSWLDMSLWDRFKAFRKHKDRKALSQDAEQLNLNKLKKLMDEGHDQVEIVERTIESGWASFFKPNGNGSGAQEDDGDEWVKRKNKELGIDQQEAAT